jgi:hypothetical protein
MNNYTKEVTSDGLSVTFVAPNGARFVCKNWARTCDKFSSDTIMQLVFNDPVFNAITEGK